MASSVHPQLSHCGVYARDVSKMVDFYTKVVGLVVSDRGIGSRGGELAFMTAAPGHHHQFVIVSGRAPEGVSTVNQLSFKVPDLDALKTLYGRAREAGIETIRQTSHGNALSPAISPIPRATRSRFIWTRPGTCRSRTACRSTCRCRTTRSWRRPNSIAARPPASCRSTNGRPRSRTA